MNNDAIPKQLAAFMKEAGEVAKKHGIYLTAFKGYVLTPSPSLSCIHIEHDMHMHKAKK